MPVVLNYFERGRPELRWGERTDNAFLDYVRSGKGVVVYHFSMAAFDGWTEYEKLSGGNWRPNNGHHSAPHDFNVDIKDTQHPITKGLKLSFPQANDELYGNLRWQPAGSYHVLATAVTTMPSTRRAGRMRARRSHWLAQARRSRCCGPSSTARGTSSAPLWDTSGKTCRRPPS